MMYNNYTDYISYLYPQPDLLKYDIPFYQIRTITFQVTDDCCCACTYCYQTNKGHKKMSYETGEKIVDLLFKMYDDNTGLFINHDTRGLVFDFIGGEPLMAIDVIDHICTYFLDKCIRLQHPWQYFWRVSFISNGALYFNPDVLNFKRKFKDFLSMGITLDGPQELHDRCRIYHNGSGNFNDAYAAWKDLNTNFYSDPGDIMTKITIAPENLIDMNTALKFFVSEGSTVINANPVFEHDWTILEAKSYYLELKKAADYLLSLPFEVKFSVFEEHAGLPKLDEGTWCGGGGQMIAFNPDGQAAPCIRWFESSLNNEVPEIIIGDCITGICSTPQQKDYYDELTHVTWVTQNDRECLDCPINQGCAECMAWSYQENHCFDKRSKHICNMHKVRSLANVYYWNNYYKLHDIDKKLLIYLSKEEALKFIDESEYNYLLELSGGISGNRLAYIDYIRQHNE